MYVAMKVNQTFISQQFNEEGSIWGGGEITMKNNIITKNKCQQKKKLEKQNDIFMWAVNSTIMIFEHSFISNTYPTSLISFYLTFLITSSVYHFNYFFYFYLSLGVKWNNVSKNHFC